MIAIEATIAGQGVLLSAQDNVELDVAAGRLLRCFDVGFHQGRYHMLFGEGVLRRKPVRLFRDWLLGRTEHLRQTLPQTEA
jgi:DNA-binding transcriptional LysR family regulator